MERLLKSALISGCAIVLVLAGLAVIDDRVRNRMVSVATTGDLSSAVAPVTHVVGSAADVAMMVARDQRLDDSLMAVFIIAAAVLVFAVLRL